MHSHLLVIGHSWFSLRAQRKWLLLLLASCGMFALSVHGARPPKAMPADMVEGYTMNGQIPVNLFYVDDTNNGTETHFKYSKKNIDAYIQGAAKIFKKLSKVVDNAGDSLYKESLRNNPYVPKDQWLHLALWKHRHLFSTTATTNSDNSNHDSSECQVCVFGSTNPWVEAAAIYMNASMVTTVEYNNLTYEHDHIRTISGYDFEWFYMLPREMPREAQHGGNSNSKSNNNHFFDVAISVSAFDHDGLGRYGDPLNPVGDIQAMKRAFDVVRPGGHLFLTVPIGPDVVVWNLLRRYGSVRLPLLLDGWEVVDRIGWVESALEEQVDWRRSFEPVFVLRKPISTVQAAGSNSGSDSDISASFIGEDRGSATEGEL